MTARRLTDFEQILLGIIVDEPSSGYALKGLLKNSPAGIYQPSSGSLYPALRRLEQNGLLRSVSDVSAGSRTRWIYHATEAGLAAHMAWVQAPVDPATIGRNLGLHLMRFVFMERLLPTESVIAFLGSLGDALGGFVAGMERYQTSVRPHEALALDHGIGVYRASYAWTRHARRVLAQAAREGATPGGRQGVAPDGEPRSPDSGTGPAKDIPHTSNGSRPAVNQAEPPAS